MNAPKSAPSLSLVIPCYNEEEMLPLVVDVFNQKIEQLVASGAVSQNSHIYFVDDGSKDKTWQLIEKYCGSYTRVKGIKLSGNRGHQNALLAGLLTAEGDVMVSLDADLQDDINAVDAMVAKFTAGAEVVFGVRSSREQDTVFKRKTAETYYGLLRKMGVNLVYNHADYRLMSRRAVEELRNYKEVNMFLRGLVPLIGFKTDTVYYARAERQAGESKYPLRKMLAFAAEGVTSFSNVPLRIITGLGMIISLAAFSMIFWVLAVRLFTEDVVPGWASIVIPMFFLSGVQLLSLGVIGEYVAKIYMETKGRPKYIVEKVI